MWTKTILATISLFLFGYYVSNGQSSVWSWAGWWVGSHNLVCLVPNIVWLILKGETRGRSSVWEMVTIWIWITAYGIILGINFFFVVVSFYNAGQRYFPRNGALLNITNSGEWQTASHQDKFYLSIFFFDFIVQTVRSAYGLYVMASLLELIWMERNSQPEKYTFEQGWKNYMVGELLVHPVGPDWGWGQKASRPNLGKDRGHSVPEGMSVTVYPAGRSLTHLPLTVTYNGHDAHFGSRSQP